MSLSEAARVLEGSLSGADVEFSSVSIDTRSLRPGDLFVAIVGKNADAHRFLDKAAQQGAVALIVSEPASVELPVIRVEDTRIALGALAREWRNRVQIPVVGVTGSNGKTSVKEMIAAILALDGPVLFTRGNLNNDIGVPLTLFGLNESHRYAVIEMGANHRGEIAYTTALARPDVGVITNAGAAHLEGFGNLDGVASAKGEIVAGLGDLGTAVLNADDPYYSFWRSLAQGRRVIAFGMGEEAFVRAREIELSRSGQDFTSRFRLFIGNESAVIGWSLVGVHNVMNALAAAAATSALGVGLEQIKQGLESMGPVPGRMRPLPGVNGSLLFDDSYNANPSSFAASVDLVAQLPGERWVMLGAFAELGESSAALHAEVGRYAREHGIRHFYATGDDARAAVAAFGEGGEFFESHDDLIGASEARLNADSIVLIKGSRSQKMERVVLALRLSEER